MLLLKKNPPFSSILRGLAIVVLTIPLALAAFGCQASGSCTFDYDWQASPEAADVVGDLVKIILNDSPEPIPNTDDRRNDADRLNE